MDHILTKWDFFMHIFKFYFAKVTFSTENRDTGKMFKLALARTLQSK